MRVEVVQQIKELAQAAVSTQARTAEIDGHTYFRDKDGTLRLIEKPRPQAELTPAPVQLSTLTGLVDWWKAEAQATEDPEKLLVHVTSTRTVGVFGPRRGAHHQRYDYAQVSALDLAADFLGREHRQDDFIVGLLTRFLDVPDVRANVMKLVGNLTEEDIRVSTDDGISAKVTVRSGISRMEDATMPNILLLHPRRSFPEIGPVPETLVLRVRKGEKGPLIALHSADAGAWRIDVIARIATWLREHLPEAKVIA